MKFKNALEPNTTKTRPTRKRAIKVATFILHLQKNDEHVGYVFLHAAFAFALKWRQSALSREPDVRLNYASSRPAKPNLRTFRCGGISVIGIHSHPPFSTGGPVAVVFTPVHSFCLTSLGGI